MGTVFEKGHEFIEVGKRRWCLKCDLFQTRADESRPFPVPRKECEEFTPYAELRREQQEKVPTP